MRCAPSTSCPRERRSPREQALAFYAPESRPVITAAFNACAERGHPIRPRTGDHHGQGAADRRSRDRRGGPWSRRSIDRVHGAFQDLSALREAEAKRRTDRGTPGPHPRARHRRLLHARSRLALHVREPRSGADAGQVARRDARQGRLGRVPGGGRDRVRLQFRRAVETGETSPPSSPTTSRSTCGSRCAPSRPRMAWPCTSSMSAPKRAAEQALAASEQRYRAAVRTGRRRDPDHGRRGRYVDANESAAEHARRAARGHHRPDPQRLRGRSRCRTRSGPRSRRPAKAAGSCVSADRTARSAKPSSTPWPRSRPACTSPSSAM